jgi:ABC-2 type transport system permease protein
MNGRRTLFPNAWYIAVREYRGRVRTRSFIAGTVLLALISFAATLLPVVIDYTTSTSQTRLAVLAQAPGMPSDSLTLLNSQLNGQSTDPNAHAAYAITWLASGDEAAVQKSLEAGKYDALLLIVRDTTTKDLGFTLRTDSPADGRSVAQIKGALPSLEIEDRLVRAGTSTDALRAPFSLTVAPVSGSSQPAKNLGQEVSSTLLSTGLILLIFMAIITYGVWVAMSVAEEKGSRVMELMLNATTPIQMLAGKVLGNGAAGLTQYGLILGAVCGGLIAQDPVHKALLGTGTGTAFGGLSPSVLIAFAVFFVLGFLLYSLLYAALGSLVSRQEEVQSATSPLMMLIMAGYFMSIFALQSIDETWVRVASLVPFFSPYLMLARVSAGHVDMWELVLAVLFLIAAIAVALFLAARIYSAGVLLYGQRVGLREVFRAARVSR